MMKMMMTVQRDHNQLYNDSATCKSMTVLLQARLDSTHSVGGQTSDALWRLSSFVTLMEL